MARQVNLRHAPTADAAEDLVLVANNLCQRFLLPFGVYHSVLIRAVFLTEDISLCDRIIHSEMEIVPQR